MFSKLIFGFSVTGGVLGVISAHARFVAERSSGSFNKEELSITNAVFAKDDDVGGR